MTAGLRPRLLAHVRERESGHLYRHVPVLGAVRTLATAGIMRTRPTHDRRRQPGRPVVVAVRALEPVVLRQRQLGLLGWVAAGLTHATPPPVGRSARRHAAGRMEFASLVRDRCQSANARRTAGPVTECCRRRKRCLACRPIRECRLHARRYSPITIPAALIGAAFLAISLATNVRRYSLDLRSEATTTAPTSRSRSCTGGVSIAATVAALSF